MSLVNDMLRDLDRRKSRPHNVSRISAAMPLELEEKQSRPWLLVAMVLAGVIIGIVAGLYLFQQNNEQSFPLAAVPAQETAPVTALAEQPLASAPAPETPAPEIVADESPAVVMSEALETEDIAEQSRMPAAAGSQESAEAYGPEPAAPVMAQDSAPTAPLASTRPQASESEADTSVTSIRQPAAPVSQSSTQVRISRELSPAEQDLRTAREAVQLIERGQLQAAFNSLYLFVSRNPEAHQSRETLATLLLGQQEYQQSEIVVEEGLSIAPNHAAYKKIKARLLSMNGETGEAIRLLTNSPPQVRDDYEYHELMAALLQHDGQHQQAIAAYQDLIRFDSRQARWWAGLAISMEASGSIAEAISGYQAALQLPGLDTGLRQYSQNRISYLNN